MTCFVCGTEREAGVNLPRAACLDCKARACLIGTGANLSFVMRSERPYPLEGSLLNGILNPVMIDGIRGWADFAAGGWAVYEERHPSADFFDFVVQHMPWGRQLLEKIIEAASDARPDHDLLVTLSSERSEANWGLSLLDMAKSAWSTAKSGQQILMGGSRIHTNLDAWAAADALEDLTVDVWDPESMITRLKELAEKR